MNKDLLILELNARWQWQIPFGWIPISGNEIIENTEIYHADYFDIFEKEITSAMCRIYNLTEVYELVEDGEISVQPIQKCTFFMMDSSVCIQIKTFNSLFIFHTKLP